MTAAFASAGYSGKSLPEKLGMRDGDRAAFIALPENLAALKSAVAFGYVALAQDWKKLSRLGTGFDFIHAFTQEAKNLARLARLQAAIKRDGAIWLSWPKKTARTASEVNENMVRDAALALDLVDVKVAAIDETWSGLKLVIRKDRR